MTETLVPNLRGVEAVAPPLRGQVGVRRFFLMHVLALVFPVTAGITLYGWRANATLGITLGAAVVCLGIWRNVGMQGRRISFTHGFWLALLLGCMLPAHLATFTYPRAATVYVWAVPAGAG